MEPGVLPNAARRTARGDVWSSCQNRGAEVAALLAALRERGNQLRPPHSKALGDGLLELRSVKHAVRVFYMFLPGKQIVLLDGIVKKRDDIPAAVVRRIRLLQGEVLAAKREGGR